jgi:hypothetical protein
VVATGRHPLELVTQRNRLNVSVSRAPARKGDDGVRETSPETIAQREHGREVKQNQVSDINKRIAAEISWSRTSDRSARTRPAREKFLQKFEKEVDPEGILPPSERQRRAEHARRAYMLRLAKRAVNARKQAR